MLKSHEVDYHAMITYLIVFAMGTLLFMGLAWCYNGFAGLIVKIDPRCVACDYNLRGLDKETQQFCPECGADLFKPDSVRFKKPKISWGHIVFGLFLIALAIGLLFVI